MTPEQKANTRKWIDALRSGEYPQCIGVLHDGFGYCCHGVAARIEGLEIEKKNKCYFVHYPTNTNSAIPPLRWFEDMYGLDRVVYTNLMDYNDTGKTFETIATYLEGFLYDE